MFEKQGIMLKTLIFLAPFLVTFTFGAPVEDDERYVSTTSRHYLPTTTVLPTTVRQLLPAITVRPPRPGSKGSDRKSDDRNVNDEDEDRYNNQHNNKRPQFEKDKDRFPSFEEWEKWKKIEEYEKWKKMDEEEKWKKWSKEKDLWYKAEDNDKKGDGWSKDDKWNKPPTLLQDDNDLSYWLFKLYCPPYIRSDPVLFKHYYNDYWPVVSTKYSLWRR